MKIKACNHSWYSASHKRSFHKLAKYVTSHYPKDVALHKAVQGCFSCFDEAAAKFKKASKKRSTPKRRMARRHWTKRRSARRAAPKRWGSKRMTRRYARRMRRTR
jgi:hypothetical protein